MEVFLFTTTEDVAAFLALPDDRIVDALQRCGLLPLNRRCVNRRCRRYCVLIRRDGCFLSHTFRCRPCNRTYSLTEGTFFHDIRIKFQTWFMILWSWVNNTRSGTVAMNWLVPRSTVIQHYRYFRDICSWKLLRVDETFLLGGPGHVVQIDESVVTRSKYHRGRRVPQRWVIGIYDATIRKGYISVVPNRTSNILIGHILKVVLPGSEIWTDCFRSYSVLSTLGGVSPYLHKTVIHHRNFVDPLTGCCTNAVEGYWSRMKGFIRNLGAMASPSLDEYVDQFLYWERYGPTPQDRLQSFLEHVAEKYSGEEEEEE